jgi:Domain of unknown function (DUF5666)
MTDVLEKPAPHDADLPAALAKAAPRRWTNRATPVLFGLLLLAGGFLGGVAVQRQWGATAPPASPASLPSAGAAVRRDVPPEPTSGTLRSVTGSTLTLQTPAGRVLTVTLTGTTRVRRGTTAADLRTGEPVTVEGTTAADGTITATEVTAS